MCQGYANGPFVARRYYTREERRAWLQQYADELDNELKAVKERIEALKE